MAEPHRHQPKIWKSRGFFLGGGVGGGGGGFVWVLFCPRNNSCDIHSFIVRVISITRFHGRRTKNGNKLGLAPYCGQVNCCRSVCSAESRKSKTSRRQVYEFILGWGVWGVGGGLRIVADVPSFLPTSALSLVVHPDKPEHTDKVYKTPKERGFKAILHSFGPFLVHPKLHWLRSVTSSYVFAMCGEVGEESSFLGGKEPTSWVPGNTLLPFRQRKYNIMKWK